VAAGDLLLLGEQGNGDGISDTPIALDWDTGLVVDAAYTPLLGGAVRVNEPGRYLVIPSLSCQLVSGSGRCGVQSYFEKLASGADAAETLAHGQTYSYVRGASGAFEGRAMSSFVEVFGANDELTMNAIRRDAQDATVIQRIEGSSLLMLKLADRWPLRS